MANNFTEDRDNLCRAALRIGGIVAQGQLPNEEQMAEAIEKLNLLLLDFDNNGIQLWMGEIVVPVSTYPVQSVLAPPDTISVEGVWTVIGGTATPLAPIEITDYMELDPAITGVPDAYYYNLINQQFYLNKTLTDTSVGLKYLRQAMVPDLMENGRVGIPKRFHLGLSYLLASLLADDYQLPLGERQYLRQTGLAMLDKAKSALANKSRTPRSAVPMDANL